MISHNLNNVFEVADRMAVLNLGRMVSVGPASEYDPQIVVELMTTGTLSHPERGPAAGNGSEDPKGVLP